MAESRICNVKENFSISELVEHLTMMYSGKGYSVSENSIGNSMQITMQKNIGGIHMITGLGERVKVTLSLNNGKLMCNFSDNQWTDKIIAALIGWLCIFIPWITGCVGIYKQSKLNGDISNEINIYLMSQ